jgi:hypothetical protein
MVAHEAEARVVPVAFPGSRVRAVLVALRHGDGVQDLHGEGEGLLVGSVCYYNIKWSTQNTKKI